MVDFSAEIDAIKEKYGERYSMNAEARAEITFLWGAECNDCGVLTNVTERIEVAHGGFMAEVELFRTAKNYWLVALSFSQPDSGYATPATIWNGIGFTQSGAARCWALDLIIHRLTAQGAARPASTSQAFIQRLEDAKTPQLSLF